MIREEHNIQVACVNWFGYQYPTLRKLLFAVPNGSHKSKAARGMFKAEGLTAGVADLILLLPNALHHSLCIEMKTKTGRQSEAQKEFEEAVRKYHNLYVVCRSVDEFIELIDKYLNNKI